VPYTRWRGALHSLWGFEETRVRPGARKSTENRIFGCRGGVDHACGSRGASTVRSLPALPGRGRGPVDPPGKKQSLAGPMISPGHAPRFGFAIAPRRPPSPSNLVGCNVTLGFRVRVTSGIGVRVASGIRACGDDIIMLCPDDWCSSCSSSSRLPCSRCSRCSSLDDIIRDHRQAAAACWQALRRPEHAPTPSTV